jgi:hypothetical protein
MCTEAVYWVVGVALKAALSRFGVCILLERHLDHVDPIET